MSAGSFRGDAADSKNNGAWDLLRRRTVSRKHLRLYRRDSSRNRDVTDRRLKVPRDSIASTHQIRRSLTVIREKKKTKCSDRQLTL